MAEFKPEELKPCPFCGGMPEFEKTDTFRDGVFFGVYVRLGCERCGVYPSKEGHIYKLMLRWDLRSDTGVTVQKDERLELVRRWNDRVTGKER